MQCVRIVTHCMTAHAQHLQPKDCSQIVQDEFQHQFVPVNVENILPVVFRKETISENETSR